jgi:hypothetical protein
MNIQKYTSFFHDGSVINIFCKNHDIEILMESSELLPTWNVDNISLSKNQTIQGKLKLEGIKSILINDQPIVQLKMLYDDGEILRFRINENKVDLLIKWMNYSSKDQKDCLEHIIIEADKIHWNNLPDLS